MAAPKIEVLTVGVGQLIAHLAPEELYLPQRILDLQGPVDEAEYGRDLLESYLEDSRVLPATVEAKPGRNAPCSCGSGKKFKKCHGA